MFAVYAIYNIAPCCIESAGVTDYGRQNDYRDFAVFAEILGYTKVEDYRGVGGNLQYHRPADGRFIVKVGEHADRAVAEFAAACIVNVSYSF